MPAEWTTQRVIILLLPVFLLVVAALVWLALRKTLRSRARLLKVLRADPDIDEYLVVFNWSRKILYLPLILTSIIAGIVTLIAGGDQQVAQVVGGVWLGMLFLNFLVDEYEMSVKVLLILLLAVILLVLWLVLLGWLSGFLSFFRRLDVEISAVGYFLIAGIFLLAIGVSWIKGLYCYAALTPNYLNLQVGPTETGEQIGHNDYSTRVDTGDFLERLLGFGRIVITFRDHRRPPLILLVGRIGRKAQALESIRGKLAIDYRQATQPPGPDVPSAGG
jgi:hypothetical protein